MNEQYENIDIEDSKDPQPLSGTALDITILADEIEVTDGARDESAREKRHQVYRERIKHFILMNDPLSRVVFDDQETIEYLLRVVMNKPDLIVADRNIQADYKNLEGRSVIMDIQADGHLHKLKDARRN